MPSSHFTAASAPIIAATNFRVANRVSLNNDCGPYDADAQ